MTIICATLFINPNIDDQVMGRREQVSLKSMHKVKVHICVGGFGDSAGWNRLAGGFLDFGRASCFCVRSFIYFQPVLRT